MTELLGQLARVLEQQRLPYAVMGGQAVLLHGEARLTRDIDITLAAPTERLGDLQQAAAAAGWRILVPDPPAFVARHLVLPCEDVASGVRLDFIFGLTRFEQEAVARAQPLPLQDARLRVVTPEDLIVFKLVAGRARDVEDVCGIIRRQRALDTGYILDWLRQFDRDLGMATEAQWRQLQNPQP